MCVMWLTDRTDGGTVGESDLGVPSDVAGRFRPLERGLLGRPSEAQARRSPCQSVKIVVRPDQGSVAPPSLMIPALPCPSLPSLPSSF